MLAIYLINMKTTGNTLPPDLLHKLNAYLKQQMQDKLIEHKHYIDKHGQDLPEIRNWKWNDHGSQNGKPEPEAPGPRSMKPVKGLEYAH